MAYRKSTLRKMSKVTKKYAMLINKLESTLRQAKALLQDIQQLEIDSEALWKIHEAEKKDEVDGEGMSEMDRQMLSAATSDLF